MRLFRFLLSLLLLRRLPFGCITNWIIRFAVWSGIGVAVAHALQPREDDAASREWSSAQSGWTSTAPPKSATRVTEAPETLSASFAADWTDADGTEHEIVETVTETVQETVEVWGSPAEETGAVDDASATDPEYEPRWIQGDGSLDCPDEYPVKANVTSMIYHMPGSRYHDATIPEVCFATEDDALAAGYRAPRR